MIPDGLVLASYSVPGIYAIVRVGTDDCYIGQSVDIRKRWDTHRRDFAAQRHASKFMQRIYDKHGAGAFEFRVLEICAAEKPALCVAEQRWIDLLAPAYNTAKVAGSCLGVTHGEETREKHRKRMLGNKYAKGSKGVRGQKRTPEQCARIAAAKMGRSHKGAAHTEETKQRISAAKTGIQQCAETVLKRSLAMKGRPWSAARRAACDRMGGPNKGRRMPQEVKDKISRTKKAAYLEANTKGLAA
jgi:group I intron endonuclease